MSCLLQRWLGWFRKWRKGIFRRQPEEEIKILVEASIRLRRNLVPLLKRCGEGDLPCARGAEGTLQRIEKILEAAPTN